MAVLSFKEPPRRPEQSREQPLTHWFTMSQPSMGQAWREYKLMGKVCAAHLVAVWVRRLSSRNLTKEKVGQETEERAESSDPEMMHVATAYFLPSPGAVDTVGGWRLDLSNF